jgi:hypothetical protein
MLKLKLTGRNSVLLQTTLGTLIFLAASFQFAAASNSGCVTCHLDKEMLKKTVTVQKSQKSAMQSGAG